MGKRIKQRNSEATLFNEMGDLLQSCISFDEVFMVVRRFAWSCSRDQSGGFIYMMRRLILLEQVVAWGENPPRIAGFCARMTAGVCAGTALKLQMAALMYIVNTLRWINAILICVFR